MVNRLQRRGSAQKAGIGEVVKRMEVFMTYNRGSGFALTLILAAFTSFFMTGCDLVQPEPTTDPARLFLFMEENPPGPEPTRFGEGWFKSNFHSAPVFSPDGNTVWWGGSFASQRIYVSHYQDGSWTEGEQVSFSDQIKSYRDPFISPDGKKFYFISTAPIPGQNESGKENIWMMEWKSDHWDEPQPLPETVNRYLLHWTVSVASNYDLYFAANIAGNPEILKSAFVNGKYTEPLLLDEPINSEFLEFTPNIAPDQSYLLFTRTEDNQSTPGLYISYAAGDGWTEPIQVENVENCISPIVTPDRKKVIYLNGPAELWWRDTSFIAELRPE